MDTTPHIYDTTESELLQGFCAKCDGTVCAVAGWLREPARTWGDLCTGAILYRERVDQVMHSAENETRLREIERQMDAYRAENGGHYPAALVREANAIPCLDCGLAILDSLRDAWARHVQRRGLSRAMCRQWTRSIVPRQAHVKPRVFFRHSRMWTQEHRCRHRIYLWPTREQVDAIVDVLERGLPVATVPPEPDWRYLKLVESRLLAHQPALACLPDWTDAWLDKWNLDGRHTRQPEGPW